MPSTVPLLLITLIACPSSCSGEPATPLEEFVRGVVFTAKRVWERWLERTPRLRMTPVEGGGLAFQLDPGEPDTGPDDGGSVPFSNNCPLCRAMPEAAGITGSWSVVLWSRNFLLTTISDLDRELNRLEAGRPSGKGSRTLAEWLADPPNVRCAQLVILDRAENLEIRTTKFEFAYHVIGDGGAGRGGRSKSIVGEWERLGGSGFIWHLVPGIRLQLCIAYYHFGKSPTQPALAGFEGTRHNNNNTGPHSNFLGRAYPALPMEFVVLNQVQEGSSLLLPCENFIVLAKRDDPFTVSSIRDFLDTRRHSFEGPFNRLERVHCNRD